MGNSAEEIGGLLARLQSHDFYDREQAVKELAAFQTDEAAAGLVLALEDVDLGIRELAAEQLCQFRGEIVAQLLIRFLGNEDIGTRNLACEILIRIGEDAVPHLIEQLSTDDGDVRKFIVDTLGLIKSDLAVEAVCNALWDENINVACSAAEALGEIGSDKAIPHLVAAAQKIEDARLQSIEALGKICHPSVQSALNEYLESDDPMILYAAIESMGRIGQAESVEKLLPFLEHADRTIAEVTLKALIGISNRTGGRIAWDLPLDRFGDYLFDGIRRKDAEITDFTLSRLKSWYGTDVVKNLLDVIDDIDEDKLLQVTEILSDIGPAAGNVILEKFPTASKGLKLKLLDIIKSFVDPELSAGLIELAGDAEPEVRQKIAHTLGVSGCREGISIIKELAVDSNGHVRAAAYAALGWLCNDDDVEFIVSGLNDKFPDIREAAVGALIIIGGPKVIKIFTGDLHHDESERQRLAVTALGWIGERDVIDPLLEATSHPEASVRKSAIKSLARIGSLPNLDAIKIALSDENSGVRKAAVSALVTLIGEKAAPDIRVLLEDEDVWVRYHTINMLAEIGKPEFIEYLMPYLSDELNIIRIAAAKALAQLGSEEALPMLGQLAQAENVDLRETARMAIDQIGRQA